MRCSRCGSEIRPEQAGEPCPSCGSLHRQIVAGDSAVGTDEAHVVGRIAADEVGVGVDEAVTLKGDEPVSPSSWLQQWERVLRWYDRIEQTGSGREHTMESDYYQDELYAFFQNCWHLKDWLKNDPASEMSRDTVETFANGPAPLGWCADLANGSKHLTLTKHRIDPTTAIGGRHFHLSLGNTGPTKIAVRYDVVGGADKRDALTLATECLAEWRQFLSDHHLL